jgi:phenylpyruvate tautomerase PptA (4-oxalocrotonate tautomerase family)
MPKMDLTIPEGALSPEAKSKLPGEMASALLRWEKAPDTEFFRSISWTHVHELPEGAIHTADGPSDQPQAVVEVTTPEGALSDRRRAGLAEELTKMILEATGWPEAAAMKVWILCREIDEGSWAAAGNVIHFEQLRAAAKAERDAAGSGKAAVEAGAGATA